MQHFQEGLRPEDVEKLKRLLSKADLVEKLLEYLERLENRNALEPLVNLVISLKPLIEYVPDPRDLSEAIGRWMEDLSKQIAEFVKPFVPAYDVLERELRAEDIAAAATAAVYVIKIAPKIADPQFLDGAINAVRDLQQYLKAFEPLIIAYNILIKDVSKEEIIKVANILAILMKLVPAILSPERVKMFTENLEESLKKAKRYGIRSLMGALRDEDVQRGLGILIAFLKALGRAYR